MQDIARNFSTIQDRIEAAALAAGRDPVGVRLMAVSKGQPVEAIAAALKAGHRLFGENRVQEARAKYPALRAAHKDLRLHLIGSLQTNKTDEAVALFDVIETLDSKKLAEALTRSIRKVGRAPEFYIEVNLGIEPQKAGIPPGDVDAFLAFCRAICGLTVTGLMCIPPLRADPAIFFTQLKELGDRFGLPNLSMGMSGDFETAIGCGATELRLGTALFGPRQMLKVPE